MSAINSGNHLELLLILIVLRSICIVMIQVYSTLINGLLCLMS